MKNKIYFIVLSALSYFQAPSNAQRFNLWNISDSHADASIHFIVGCPEPIPFKGYFTSISNDTCYIKAFYPVIGCYAQYQSTNRDTMYNVAFPSETNYINISKNNLHYRESTQTYDTSWNVKDSTFALHPTAINAIYKNSPVIRVYPNPAGATLYFDKGMAYEQVEVYNSAGRRLAANGTGGGGDQSPDIWVRNQNDGMEHQEHETPEYQNGSPAYVYVKVRNKSCVTSAGTEMLRLYWHYASAGGTGWPGGWDGSASPAQGGLAAEAMIPVLKPGEATIVPLVWQMDAALENAPNACLLARIEDVAADPIDDSYSPQETHLMISRNNNVAIKNTSVVNVLPGFAPWPGFVGVFNESLFTRNYNLHIRVPGWGDGFAHDITKEAEVKVAFDAAGWNMLLASGSLEQEGVRKGGERELILASPDITFGNLAFAPGAAMRMEVKFSFLTDEYTEKKTYQLAFSTEAADEPGEVLGTETFIVHKYSREMFDADAGADKSAYPAESVQLSARDIDEPAAYNWYDKAGNLVYTGRDWTVTADMTKQYKLEVISLADGFKDYDEVRIDVKKYYLTGIAPNPAGAQTAVGYHAEGAASAYLVLVQPFGNTVYNYILDAGENSYNLNTTALPSGVYNVILVCDGVMRDSRSLQVN